MGYISTRKCPLDNSRVYLPRENIVVMAEVYITVMSTFILVLSCILALAVAYQALSLHHTPALSSHKETPLTTNSMLRTTVPRTWELTMSEVYLNPGHRLGLHLHWER